VQLGRARLYRSATSTTRGSTSPLRHWLPELAAVAAVLAVAAVIVGLRAANDGPEPVDQNWSLAAELVVAFAYLPTGVALLRRREKHLLGALFATVAVAGLVGAVAVQYLGYLRGQQVEAAWPGLASLGWAWAVGSAVLVGPLLLTLLPPTWRHERRVRAAMALAGAAVVVIAIERLTDEWPQPLPANPLELHGAARGVVDWAGDIATMTVAVVATVAVLLLALDWRDRRRTSDDPLPAWMLAGAVAAWLAVVPTSWSTLKDHLPAPDVIPPLLLMATVPLLVVGTMIEIVRTQPSALEGVSRRFLEWALLAAAVFVLYTGLVAGLGSLVGGDGPTWFLVAATGAIALLAEPARQRIRTLVDALVYGSRDDALSLVRQVVAHVSTASDDDLLPALAASLGREMRLDTVAIDVARPDGWDRAALHGTPTPVRTREVPLRHHDEVVGRLTVGWSDAASLRPRDVATLEELAVPLALAVSWVRLAADLRRSSLAVVSAREEERRRLRRDLHDGLGPALTGISLGLRTAIRRIERSDRLDAGAPLGLLCRLADEVDTTVGEVKRIVRDLRPTALDQLGLVGAVTEFARTIDGAVELHVDVPAQQTSLPAAVEVATYRIVTEAVTNVVRHAAATTCWLKIAAGSAVEIDVVDDGIGLAPDTPPGIGLVAIRERAVELGGTMTITAHVPHGTHVHVRLPAVLP
jgi:signal transduction histidine kinase